MTEAELMSLGQEAWSNVLALTALYLSVLTGYLVVAYSVGKKLTSRQVLIINSFFVIVALFLIAAQGGFAQLAIEAELEAKEMSSWRTSPVYPFIPYTLGTFYILFVFVSLKFMRDTRNGKE